METHSSAGHPGEFFGGVELVDIANVGAEENLSSCSRESLQCWAALLIASSTYRLPSTTGLPVASGIK